MVVEWLKLGAMAVYGVVRYYLRQIENQLFVLVFILYLNPRELVPNLWWLAE